MKQLLICKEDKRYSKGYRIVEKLNYNHPNEMAEYIKSKYTCKLHFRTAEMEQYSISAPYLLMEGFSNIGRNFIAYR